MPKLCFLLPFAGAQIYLTHVLPDPYHEREELGMAASMSGGVNIAEPETPKQKFSQRVRPENTGILTLNRCRLERQE